MAKPAFPPSGEPFSWDDRTQSTAPFLWTIADIARTWLPGQTRETTQLAAGNGSTAPRTRCATGNNSSTTAKRLRAKKFPDLLLPGLLQGAAPAFT